MVAPLKAAYVKAKASRAKWVFVAGAVLCLCAILAFVFLRPTAPQRIAQKALNALERRDVEALCQLADKEEFTRLNLSPAKVEYLLNQTVWSGVIPQGGTVQFNDGMRPIDQSIWEVKWRDAKSRPLYITVNQEQNGRWRLNFARLLYASCWWQKEGSEGMKLYYEIAKEKGINGYRNEAGGYVSMEYLRDNVTKFFGSK